MPTGIRSDLSVIASRLRRGNPEAASTALRPLDCRGAARLAMTVRTVKAKRHWYKVAVAPALNRPPAPHCGGQGAVVEHVQRTADGHALAHAADPHARRGLGDALL